MSYIYLLLEVVLAISYDTNLPFFFTVNQYLDAIFSLSRCPIWHETLPRRQFMTTWSSGNPVSWLVNFRDISQSNWSLHWINFVLRLQHIFGNINNFVFSTPYNHIGLWFEVKKGHQKISYALKIDDRSNISHALKSRLLKISHPLIFSRTFSYPLIFRSKFSYPLKFAPTGYPGLKKTNP